MGLLVGLLVGLLRIVSMEVLSLMLALSITILVRFTRPFSLRLMLLLINLIDWEIGDADFRSHFCNGIDAAAGDAGAGDKRCL